MIEFREPTEGRSASLVIDGELMPRDQASAYLSGGGHTAFIRGPRAEALIRRQRITEFPIELSRILIDTDESVRHTDLILRPQFLRQGEEGPFTFQFLFVFRVAFWKRPFSMGEFREVVQKAIEDHPLGGLEWVDRRGVGMMPNFTVSVGALDRSSTVAEMLDRWVPHVRAIKTEAERTLAGRLKKESLVALFDFPPEVKAPCEQYLLYFIEFLKDLGVEAQADLTHDAGRVLFSVTPASGKDALARIQEALEAYLELPGAQNIGGMTSIESDPRVQQLAANIQHLKGQLYLATAALQFKDATIAQMNTLQRQSQPLTADVMQTSLRLIDSAETCPDREEIIEGVVALKKYDGKGFEVNLPELYRRLKKAFGRSESPPEPQLLQNRGER